MLETSLETQFKRIISRYRSHQYERSVAKNIPIRRLPLFKMLYPGKYRYRYRGKSIHNFYKNILNEKKKVNFCNFRFRNWRSTKSIGLSGKLFF